MTSAISLAFCVHSPSHYLPVLILQPTTSIGELKDQKYDEYSRSYDNLNGGIVTKLLGLDGMRENTASKVSGKVLKVAVGTGLQSSYYDWSKISQFSGID